MFEDVLNKGIPLQVSSNYHFKYFNVCDGDFGRNGACESGGRF